MDERSSQPGATERPIPTTDEVVATAGPGHLADPRALTILTTEHWSLLTARSLVYNEAFARAGMFLTFLTGTLVALGFVSQGSGYGPEFLTVATALLGFDMVIGLATLGRMTSAGIEEFYALQGMNRLRHAYLEMVPTLKPYFSTSPYDDLLGFLSIYGASQARGASFLRSVVHGLTTAGGMVGLITAVVGGAFAAAVALLLGASATLGILFGLAGFMVLTGAIWISILRLFQTLDQRFEVRFPPPPDERGGPKL